MQPRLWRYFDIWLFLLAIGLVFYGLAMIYSATYAPGLIRSLDDDPFYRQIVWTLISLILMLTVINIDYHLLANLAIPAYLLGVGMIGATLVVGTVMHGGQRWLAGGAIQPSEIAKLLLIISWAKWLADHERQLKQFRYLVLSGIMMLVPVMLTAAQPDLGTSLIFVAIWLGMILMAGARLIHLTGVSVACLAIVAVNLEKLLHSYQMRRIEVFLDPTTDAMGEGYNIIQALTAIGSGGLSGKGYLAGTQSQLQFLSVQHADFIFSVVCEELGFIGALTLMLLFIALLMRILRVSERAADSFGRLLAIGVCSMLFFQFFINISMNLKLVPAVGIPLPFISAGGSSLMTTLISLGILESIVMRRRRIEFL